MKRLSNKKYSWTDLLWVIVALWIMTTCILILACPAKAEEPSAPFCKMWNTMGDEPGGEPLTAAQRKMYHLGYWLTKEDLVRSNLNQHFEDNLLVDLTVTCYTEHVIFLVEETDGICQCSEEDKQEQVLKAFNAYINDCVKEAAREVEKK